MKSITRSIDHFNLAGVDLNLLVVFDALMTEKHLTRASVKIGLSQPATSNALGRLRKLLKDDLFIKSAKGITPTSRAIALAEPIRIALEQIEDVVTSKPEFYPETSDRIFRIGMDDYTEIVFLSKLLEKFSEIASNVRVQIRSSTWQKAPQLLDNNEIDLALGYFPNFSSWHQYQQLYVESFICVGSQDYFSLTKKITMEEYLKVKHLLVSPKEDMVGIVDRQLAEQGLQRIIALSVPNFLIVPFILSSTELIATLPAQIVATLTNKWSFYTSTPPLSLEGFPVGILWHRKDDRDLGHIWLRQVINDIKSR